MSVKIALCVLVTVLLSSCSSGMEAKKSAANPEADRTAIKKVVEDFTSAFNAGDAQHVAALYTEDAVVMPQNQEALVGRMAVEAYNKGFFDQFTPKIAIASQEVTFTGDDWAFDRGTYTLSLTPKTGGAAMEDVGKYVVILHRQADGTWKVARDIDNSSKPVLPPPTMGGKK